MDALQRISTGIELLEGGYTVEWTPSRETEPGVRTMAYPNYDRRLMEALWGASELVGTDYGCTEPDERGAPAGSRAKPVWGRAALLVFLGSLLLTYVGTPSNVLPGAGWAIGLLVAMGGGVVFSIVSLVRRERRGAALATLVISLGLPLAVFVGFAVFFTFFYVA